MNFIKCAAAVGLTLALVACGGGGGSAGTPVTESNSAAIPPASAASEPVAANLSVASIRINSSSTTLNADGSSTLTLTIYALTSGNASVAGATINLAATDGVILSAPSVVTSATGATLTMMAASSDQTNRSATVTASCSGCAASPATTQVTVVGASIALTNSGSASLIVGGSSSTLTATVKSFAGAPLVGVPVSFAATDPLILGLSQVLVTTNNAGVASIAVSGVGAGSAIVNVSALGNAKSQAFTSGLPAAVLAITSPANNAVLETGIPQVITVSAPTGATSITFTTNRGVFSLSGTNSQTVSIVDGIATASLSVTSSGTTTITVTDNMVPIHSANLTLVVSPPATAANKILLAPSKTTLPISIVGGSQNSLTITARAVKSDGTTDEAVANVPIEFSMTGGPGAGEFLTPALAYTNASGDAVATFTSGTAASISNGISVSAKIQGTTVQTGTSPSNNNVLLTIGGQALSVAFGPATVLGESSDKTLYIQSYSVQVTDANNNPVQGQSVTLRLRPVAFSLGAACTVAATYCSEDYNGNGSLDLTEDGVRIPITAATAGTCPANATDVTAAADFPGGRVDAFLTPSNSDGGSVPSIVTTDATGVAAFNLTYLKGSALWVVNRLTATVSSVGTETSKSTIFRLPASVTDLGPPCSLPASPYSY